MTTTIRKSYEDKLTRLLEPWALRHLAPALDGNADAAVSLVGAAGNDKRGILAVDFWRIKVAVPAYQALLSAVWCHDHRELIAAAGSRRALRAMFRYAAFALPSDLPDVVPIWRGTSGATKQEAIGGYSWTADRDVACWFAIRYAKYYGEPLVLAANASRTDIAHYGDERNEKEMVIFNKLNAWVDGSVDDWKLAFQGWEDRKNADAQSRLKRHI